MKKERRSPINPKQGARLREVLKENRITQGQLANNVLKTSQQAVSKYVNNERPLPWEYAEKIGEKYGVRPAWLIGFDDHKTELDAAIEEDWESMCKAEELLSAIGFCFEMTDDVKKVPREYISEDTGERKVFIEEDRDDISAYRIILGGREVGRCSIREYDRLIDAIVDNAGAAVKYLAERRENNNG